MQTAPKLLYVVTEDWFFCLHFLPMARAARRAGFDVAIACRLRDKAAELAGEGFRVVPVDAERGDKGVISLLRNAVRLAAVLRDEKPDIVHFISLRPVLMGGLVAKLLGVQRRVFAITGLGPLNGPPTKSRAMAMVSVRSIIRWIGGRGSRFLFENRDDPPRLGLDPSNPSQVCVIGGTGVDPELFQPSPEPAGSTLRTAIVSRMLWTKGIDTAVAAVRSAREAGGDVTLSLYGVPDPSNARSIPQDILEEWCRHPGIAWHGYAPDVRDVWRDHHVAVLPSHGEGMPRMLMEAAACGRPMVATDVSGCRTIVQDGVSGFLVPVGDARGLAEALLRLAADPALRARMGQAARATILAGYTEERVAADVETMYRDLLRD